MQREKLISRIERHDETISVYGSKHGMRVVIELVDSTNMLGVCNGMLMGSQLNGTSPTRDIRVAARANKKFIAEYKKLERARQKKARSLAATVASVTRRRGRTKANDAPSRG
jgi:phosphoribosylformylglycinamidine (FGAM) synthase-like amidotransferase family enzyme